MQCVERVYSIRRVTSVIGGEGVWCEEKVFIMRNVTPVVPIENVFSTRRVTSAVRGEILQHEEGVQCKKGTSVVERQGKKKETSAEQRQCVWCDRGESLQDEECHVCNTQRENVQYQEKVVQCEQKFVQFEKTCTVSEKLHLQ